MSKKKQKIKPADKAFMSSDKHTLNDLKLEPWTPQRVWTSGLLGMTYPNLSKEGAEQFRKSRVYPEAVKDLSIFLYLSTIKPNEVDEAERYPDAAYEKAKAFGISRNLHKRDSVEFWQAYTVFWEVMNEIENSATKPKGSSANTDDDEFPNG